MQAEINLNINHSGDSLPPPPESVRTEGHSYGHITNKFSWQIFLDILIPINYGKYQPLDFHVLKDHLALEECEQHPLCIFSFLGE